MHAYGYPNAKYPLTPGTVVEHKYMPNVPLIVVSGPEKSPTGRDKYTVRTPGGVEESVLRENLKT
jgi:hypothetical protein